MARWPSGKAGACKALTTGSNPVLASIFADMAQLVEHHLAKVGVAGSSPVVRSSLYCAVLTNGVFSFRPTLEPSGVHSPLMRVFLRDASRVALFSFLRRDIMLICRIDGAAKLLEQKG